VTILSILELLEIGMYPIFFMIKILNFPFLTQDSQLKEFVSITQEVSGVAKPFAIRIKEMLKSI